MRIQCPCGAKYSLDVTPDMAGRPVRFVCQSCGLDSSEAVNAMIRQELSEQPAPMGILAPAETEVAKPEAPPAPAMPVPPVGPARIRLHTATTPQVAAPPAVEETPTQRPCLKHPGQFMVHECMVCGKPMC